jgi:hypothetical protein
MVRAGFLARSRLPGGLGGLFSHRNFILRKFIVVDSASVVDPVSEASVPK